MTRFVWFLRPRVGRWLIAGLCVPLGVMVWISYRAAAEWRRSATELAEQRAAAGVDLLTTALGRDMRAVQMSVLSDRSPDQILAASSDPDGLIASAFARYPYPEVFFTWSATLPSSEVTFYSRSERHPAWLSREGINELFPVAVSKDPETGRRLLTRTAVDAGLSRRYSVFDVTVPPSTYQVVVLLAYDDPFREHLSAEFGFMVNLEWARLHYVQELTAQVRRVGQAGGALELMILDANGATIAGPQRATDGVVARRRFPILFFDPHLVAVEWPADLGRDFWTTQAVVPDDRTLASAINGATQVLTVSIVSAAALMIGLLLIIRAARANARLADLRSEFVSSVTHELRTPISTIQTIAETFASNRGVTPELSRKFGHMALQEAKRLRRLIDNLLAYARITDVADVYSFGPVAPESLVEDMLRSCASQLEYAKFTVDVDVPPGLPNVRVDRTAILLALTNLVDNAIRYSKDTRHLAVSAHGDGADVVFDITDQGMGIPENDLPHITRRFFRGKDPNTSGGTGLGLAIVERIVIDHRGSLEFRSEVDRGTTVSLLLPAAEATS